MEKETIRYRYRGDKTCEQIEKDRLAQEKEKEKRAQEPKPERRRVRARAQNPEPAEAPEPAPARKPKRKPKRKLKVVKPEPAPKPDPEPARKPKPEPPPPPEPPDVCNPLTVQSTQNCIDCEVKRECDAGLHFSQIPHFVIEQYMALMSHCALKVFLAIGSRVNFSEKSEFFGKTYMTYNEIAERAHVHKSNVHKHLKELEHLGLIQRENGFIHVLWPYRRREIQAIQ